MGSQTNDSYTRLRTVAKQLADELGGFDEQSQISEKQLDRLSPIQDAIIADTFGLLTGIADATITNGQPRIRDNILQLIEEVAAAPESEDNQSFITLLCSILSQASGEGLTAENQSLHQLRQHRSR